MSFLLSFLIRCSFSICSKTWGREEAAAHSWNVGRVCPWLLLLLLLLCRLWKMNSAVLYSCDLLSAFNQIPPSPPPSHTHYTAELGPSHYGRHTYAHTFSCSTSGSGFLDYTAEHFMWPCSFSGFLHDTFIWNVNLSQRSSWRMEIILSQLHKHFIMRSRKIQTSFPGKLKRFFINAIKHRVHMTVHGEI